MIMDVEVQSCIYNIRQYFIRKSKTSVFRVSHFINEIYLGSLIIIFNILKMLVLAFQKKHLD